MLNFAKKRKRFFIISGLVILAGIISLSIAQLNLGIDFESGYTMTINFEDTVEQTDLRDTLIGLGYDDAIIQQARDPETDEQYYLIRFKLHNDENSVEESNAVGIAITALGAYEEITSNEVSGGTASSRVRNAGYAVLAAVIGILIYITWAFRKLPKPFHYGICALIALVHDMLIMIGIFSILGWAANVEVNSMFVIAALTILGYSVNDTIVVFDRIRENLLKGEGKSFAETVNISINESLGRSLATSVTTLLVLLALYLFGGSTISTFVLALIIGVVSGTYSSIFIASQVLVSWEEGTFGRIYRKTKGLFGRGKPITIGGDDQQA
ncbi:protein translocase subunit SecF [Chloroflexota bacterium]